MSWADVDRMLERFNAAHNPELTQLTGPASGTPDEEAIQAALDEAEAIIAGYLGGRELGVADNANLARIHMDIARWTLYRDAVPDRVQQIYLADIDQLKAISKREQTLAATATGTAATVSTGSITGLLDSRGF